MSKYANEMALNEPKKQAKETSGDTLLTATYILFGRPPLNQGERETLDRFIINCIKSN